MSKAKTSRKQLFRAALAIAGLTAEQWGAREGVTSGHLSMILSGVRYNEGIVERIDAFTKQQLKKPISLAS
jgi:hypothetical protein